jgi:AbrB family looped-hinge helix DNA binding protein
MEIRIGNKGRVTLPLKLRMLLGIKEGDSLTIEVTSRGILLKPKGASAKETWGQPSSVKLKSKRLKRRSARNPKCASSTQACSYIT